MKSHRIVIHLGVLLAVVLALPAPALASSLLSGYGGPGQGNQAILGSAMLNGPKGGGGSGSGSGSSAPTSGAGESSTTSSSGGEPSSRGSGAGTSGGDNRSSGGSGSSGAANPSVRHTSAKGGAQATTTAQTEASFYPAVAAERVPSGAQDGALGLSGSDVLYIVLAVGVLVSLGVITRRMGAVTEREGHGS